MATDPGRVPLRVVPAGPGADVSDQALVEALFHSEDWAVAATWNRFGPLVYGIALRALGAPADAEDVAQEVFYRLFSRIKTLKKPEAFRSFVVSFAIRIVKWELRKRRARRWILLSESGHLPDAPSIEGSPEVRHVLQRFYKVLDQLAARDRLVFSLRFLESMTLEEIAAALEVSLSTVKRSLERASTHVATWIADDADLGMFFEGRRDSVRGEP